MPKLAIVKTTKNAQADLVLRGVYGTMRDCPPLSPDATPERKFVVASEFRAVSKVFEDLDSVLVSMPGEQTEYLELDLTEEDVPHIKNSLMLQLGIRHDHLYSRSAGQAQGLAAAIFQAEQRRAKSGVEQFFYRQNLSAWTVPVKSTVRSGLDGAYYQTRDDLFSVLRGCIPVTAVVDETRQVTQSDTPEENNVIAPIEEGAHDGGEAAQDAPPWSDYSGVEADMQSSIIVMANSAEHARTVATAVLAVQDRLSEASRASGENLGLMIVNHKVPTGIITVRPLSPVDPVTHEADQTPESFEDGPDDCDDDGQPRFGRGYF